MPDRPSRTDLFLARNEMVIVFAFLIVALVAVICG
jgi:hypothetical protein